VTSGADLLRKIQPVKRREETQICFRADLIKEFIREDQILGEMQVEDQAKAGKRLASGGFSDDTKKQARKVRKLEKAIEDNSMDFEFESMGKDRWRELCDDNPPRQGNQMDSFIGHNRDAVLDVAVRECLVSPTFEDCANIPTTPPDCPHTGCGSWQELVIRLNPSEWQELKDTVARANSAVVDDPKSAAASRVLGTPNGTSRSRGRGESVPAGSTGGSPSSGTST
jgi:hypothetical protein